MAAPFSLQMLNHPIDPQRFFWIAVRVDSTDDISWDGLILWVKGQTYYFDRRVPKDIQAHNKASRIVICLKTDKKDKLRA